MFDIPSTYKDAHQDYLTHVALRRFVKDNNVKVALAEQRQTLLDAVVEYGCQGPEQEERVQHWLDASLREGIKEFHLFLEDMPRESKLLFATPEAANRFFEPILSSGYKRHICGNSYGKALALIDAKMTNCILGRRLEFRYCRRLVHYESKPSGSATKIIEHPLFAEYYIDLGCLVISAKPRSNIYVYESPFRYEDAKKTATDKEINAVRKAIEQLLSLKQAEKVNSSTGLKKRIFSLLNDFTQTPVEIIAKMDEKADTIDEMIGLLTGICAAPSTIAKDIRGDISNLVEKYLSITWPDKDVFTKDREAYPISLCATDEEDSTVEQKSFAAEPLQTKAIFFDNKKMLHKNKSCDGMKLCWKKRSNDSKFFSVRIFVKPNGTCVIKFPEYTEQEDIDYVIFSVIGTKGIGAE